MTTCSEISHVAQYDVHGPDQCLAKKRASIVKLFVEQDFSWALVAWTISMIYTVASMTSGDSGFWHEDVLEWTPPVAHRNVMITQRWV